MSGNEIIHKSLQGLLELNYKAVKKDTAKKINLAMRKAGAQISPPGKNDPVSVLVDWLKQPATTVADGSANPDRILQESGKSKSNKRKTRQSKGGDKYQKPNRPLGTPHPKSTITRAAPRQTPSQQTRGVRAKVAIFLLLAFHFHLTCHPHLAFHSQRHFPR